MLIHENRALVKSTDSAHILFTLLDSLGKPRPESVDRLGLELQSKQLIINTRQYLVPAPSLLGSRNVAIHFIPQ